MDLIIIPQYFYPTYGGLQHFTRRLCEALIKYNVNVTIIAPKPEMDRDVIETNWENSDITFKTLEGTRTEFWNLLKTEVICSYPKHFKILVIGLEFDNLIEYQMDFMDKLIKNEFEVYLRIATSDDFSEVISWNPKRLEIVNRITSIIVMTEEMKAEILPFIKIKSKIKIIPNLIDFKQYYKRNKIERHELRLKHNIPINSFIALWTGRLTSQKRILHLLDIWYKADIDGYLLIVGNDSYKDRIYLKKIMNLINLKKIKNVIFMGPYKEKEMPEIYNCADVFLFTSFREGLSNSLLEACACGLPAIAYSIPCTNLILKSINPHYHRIIEKNKMKEFVEALKQSIISTKNLIETNDNRHIFFNENIAQKYIEILKN